MIFEWSDPPDGVADPKRLRHEDPARARAVDAVADDRGPDQLHGAIPTTAPTR